MGTTTSSMVFAKEALTLSDFTRLQATSAIELCMEGVEHHDHLVLQSWACGSCYRGRICPALVMHGISL